MIEKHQIDIYVVLLGNKCDKEIERKVTFEEAKKFADLYEIQFYEVSAKTGENIEDAFYNIIDRYYENHDPFFKNNRVNTHSINQHTSQSK